MTKIFGGRLRALAIGFTVLSIVIGPARIGVNAVTQSMAAGSTTSRSFVYTITNPDGPNSIAAYERNAETGELIFLAAYSTGGRGSGRLVDSQSPLVASADGHFLFASQSWERRYHGDGNE
jgi:hypothetical protein